MGDSKGYYKPSLIEINIFQVQKVLELKTNERDKLFWNDRGWISSTYVIKLYYIHFSYVVGAGIDKNVIRKGSYVSDWRIFKDNTGVGKNATVL